MKITDKQGKILTTLYGMGLSLERLCDIYTQKYGIKTSKRYKLIRKIKAKINGRTNQFPRLKSRIEQYHSIHFGICKIKKACRM